MSVICTATKNHSKKLNLNLFAVTNYQNKITLFHQPNRWTPRKQFILDGLDIQKQKQYSPDYTGTVDKTNEVALALELSVSLQNRNWMIPPSKVTNFEESDNFHREW